MKTYNDKNANNATESRKDPNATHLYCPSKSHNKTAESPYPQDKVPIHLFRKVPNNPNSVLLKECAHCRSLKSVQKKKRIALAKYKAVVNNKFFCTNCHHEKELDERAINLDGSPSILCKTCKIGEKTRSLDLRESFRIIKLEFAYKLGSCCELCNCMYIRFSNGNCKWVAIQTYLKGDERYFSVGDTEYNCKQIISETAPLVELDILDLDHLTEEEQRSRGLLKPTDVCIPKTVHVSKLSSETAMRLEARKCQLLCGRCHVLHTKSRELAIDPLYGKSTVEKIKLIHTWNAKLIGCQLCGYKEETLPRYFHFDHLDQSTKIKEISRMVKDNSYTLDDVISELKKCRVLCLHCHRLHTLDQRKK